MSPAPRSQARTGPARPGINTLPIQAPQVTKEQLQDPGYMNVLLQQLFTAVNQGNGSLGPVRISSGLDMAGARVTNVGTPESDGDAISSGHAATQYSPAAQQQQLDVGKPHALKGLTTAYGLSVQNNATLGAIQKGFVSILTGGGTSVLATPIIQMGDTGAIATTLAVMFPQPYQNSIPFVFACDNYASGAFAQISVVKSSVTKTGFTLHSNITGNGAFWIAIGN